MESVEIYLELLKLKDRSTELLNKIEDNTAFFKDKVELFGYDAVYGILEDYQREIRSQKWDLEDTNSELEDMAKLNPTIRAYRKTFAGLIKEFGNLDEYIDTIK